MTTDEASGLLLCFADFLALVTLMREAQRTYYQTRDQGALIRAKDLERQVDRAIGTYGRVTTGVTP